MSLRMFHRGWLAALLLLPSFIFAQVGAPEYVAGEAWTYREINGFNNIERNTVVREVTGVSGGVAQMRTLTADGRLVDEAVLAGGTLRDGWLSDRAAGVLDPGLDLRPFPLNAGNAWTQRVTRIDRQFKDRRAVRVDGKVLGWETVKVPAGEFKAIKLERQMYLGDADPFRQQTIRTETEWYVPELKAAAKLQVREFYSEGSNLVPARFQPGDWFIRELTGFKRAGR